MMSITKAKPTEDSSSDDTSSLESVNPQTVVVHDTYHIKVPFKLFNLKLSIDVCEGAKSRSRDASPIRK